MAALGPGGGELFDRHRPVSALLPGGSELLGRQRLPHEPPVRLRRSRNGHAVDARVGQNLVRVSRKANPRVLLLHGKTRGRVGVARHLDPYGPAFGRVLGGVGDQVLDDLARRGLFRFLRQDDRRQGFRPGAGVGVADLRDGLLHLHIADDHEKDVVGNVFFAVVTVNILRFQFIEDVGITDDGEAIGTARVSGFKQAAAGTPRRIVLQATVHDPFERARTERRKIAVELRSFRVGA